MYCIQSVVIQSIKKYDKFVSQEVKNFENLKS